jgi:hypothetical protein
MESSSPLPPLIAAPTAPAPDADTAEAPEVQTPAQIRKFVADKLRQIDGMPPKCEVSFLGPHAKAIVSLGRRSAPYLVEKLTDTTPTNWGGCNHYYVIGDFADELLHFLYDCEGPRDIPCDCNRSRPRQADRSGGSIPYFVGSIVARGVVRAFHFDRAAAHERCGARSA